MLTVDVKQQYNTMQSDNIYIRFGIKLYRQIVGIPMDTNFPSLMGLVFFFFCHERDFMSYPSDNKESEIIQAFNSTSRSFKYWQSLL